MAQFYFKQEAKILGQSPNITRREPNALAPNLKEMHQEKKLKKGKILAC